MRSRARSRKYWLITLCVIQNEYPPTTRSTRRALGKIFAHLKCELLQLKIIEASIFIGLEKMLRIRNHVQVDDREAKSSTDPTFNSI